MSIKVVVLDIDDTLYLERDYVRSGFAAVGQYVLQEHGLTGFGETCWNLFLEGVRGDTFNRATSMHGVDLPVSKLTMVYRCHEPQIELLPDALAFLESLRDISIAVITDGPAESQNAKIASLGLQEWSTNTIVTSEHGIDWAKPSPKAFNAVEDFYCRTGSELCYIADNPTKDFITPQQLGWKCIRVRRRQSLYGKLATPESVAELNDLESLHKCNKWRD